jgi:hypothetical protein
MELMVGMVIMTILMTICTSAIVSMFAGTGKTQAVANSAQQLNTAFVRLDDQVRYATAIDQPTGSLATNNLSVAFFTVNSTPTSITRTCSQLRIQTMSGTSQQQLVERSWPVNADGSVTNGTITPWNQLAGGISVLDQNGATVVPFAVSVPAGATVQQLRLRLIDLDSTGQTPTKSFSEIAFSALNSTDSANAVKYGSYVPACSQAVST